MLESRGRLPPAETTGGVVHARETHVALFRKKQPDGDANGNDGKAEFTPQPGTVSSHATCAPGGYLALSPTEGPPTRRTRFRVPAL